MSVDYEDKDKVVACLKDIMEAVQSIAEFERRCILVFDDDDAIDKLSALKRWPAAVVQYEGMRAEGETGSYKMGGSAVLVVSVIVINQGQDLVKTDTKVPSLLLLTQIRRKMMGRTSPSGYKWAFVVEAPATAKANMSFWVQRWQCPLVMQLN